jgi:hypothetical protein
MLKYEADATFARGLARSLFSSKQDRPRVRLFESGDYPKQRRLA